MFGVKVWVIEPFYVYHHQGEMRFYPSPLSRFIYRLISKRKISLIKAKDLNPQGIFLQR